MRKPNIAILGATGVVGREITKIIDELKIEFNEIKVLPQNFSHRKLLNAAGFSLIIPALSEWRKMFRL